MTPEEELEILRRKLIAAERTRGHEERALAIRARIAELENAA
jgi:hypothetical protein